MSDADWDEDDYDDGYDPDDDWYDDRDDYREPDPEDAETARAYEELYEHEERAHGGGPCTCRPSLWARSWHLRQRAAGFVPGLWYRLRHALRQPWTIRVPGAEITVRLRPRSCGACGGRGWNYSLIPGRPDDRPPGYNGVGLCGCGAAIGKLAESRRELRKGRNEPPF